MAMTSPKCQQCNSSPAVFSYRYAWPQIASKDIKEIALCANCLTHSVESRVLTHLQKIFVQARKVNSPGTRPFKVGLCFSGGKDSAALLYIINKNSYLFQEEEFTIISVDEGIENRDSLKELVAKVSTAYKIPYIFVSFKERYGKSLTEMKQLLDSITAYGRLRICDLCTILKSNLYREIAKGNGILLLVDGCNISDKAAGFLQTLMSPDFLLMKAIAPNKWVSRIAGMTLCTDEELAAYVTVNEIEVLTQHSCANAEESMIKKIKECLKELERKLPGFFLAIYPNIIKLEILLKKVEIKQEISKAEEFAVCSCGRLMRHDERRCVECEVLQIFSK